MNSHLSKYYKVFGLPLDASPADIKKRYRQLALHYHPDKFGGNQEKFLAIKEAYEYLTGKREVSSSSVNQSVTNSRSTSQARGMTQEERIKQAYQRQKETEYKEFIENEKFYQSIISGKLWRFLRFTSYIGAFLTFMVLIDFFLPYTYEPERIVACENERVESFSSDSGSFRKIYTESGESYYSEDFVNYLVSDPSVFIVRTSILHNEIGFVPFFHISGKPTDLSKFKPFPIHFTIGAHSLFFLPFLILPFLVVTFKRKNYTFTLLYYLSIYLFTPFIYIYLISGERWLHILTLGYL